jgi:hypothetical protein
MLARDRVRRRKLAAHAIDNARLRLFLLTVPFPAAESLISAIRKPGCTFVMEIAPTRPLSAGRIGRNGEDSL